MRWYYLLLYVIMEMAKDQSGKSTPLLLFTSDKIKTASGRLEVRKICINVLERLRVGKRIHLKLISAMIRLINLASNSTHGITAIATHDGFDDVLDYDFHNGLVDDKALVLHRLRSGLDMIGLVSDKWELNATEVISSVFGLNDFRNSINSGFTHDAPGFMSFNINCDPEVIGEQIVHETTHLLFDNLLFFNDNVRKFVSCIPPIFSPFANKPRTAEYVIHGLFSYTSVFIYWKELQEKGLDRLDISGQRIRIVREYIYSAVRNLANVLDNRDWLRLDKIYKSLTHMQASGVWDYGNAMPSNIIPGEVLRLIDGKFSNIEKAEIILALEGQKVSRISKSINSLREVIETLNRLRIRYCFSNFLFESESDEGLNDFSNRITKLHNLDSVESTHLDIHIYLSKHRSDLLKSYSLDVDDRSGDLFGIPTCCQFFFYQNWDKSVRKYNGDLARVIYGAAGFTISDAHLYSPVSMYFDSGYCWHFPCSPRCEATRRVVDKRMAVMKKYPELHAKLLFIERNTVRFDPLQGYLLE
jgi:hypothetical protein